MGKLKLILFLLSVVQLYSQTLEFQLINKFEYELSEINDFSIDSDGNFYLLDSQDNCIYKYSETGEYVQTIARKGKGPGELLMPLLLEIDKNNNIVIANVGNSRFEVLSKSGDYISSFKFPSSSFATTAFKINSKNELIVAFNDNYQGTYYIQKWTLDGVLIKELCKFQKTSYSNLVKHPVVPQKLLLTIDSEDNIYISFSDEKEIQILDKAGKLKEKILNSNTVKYSIKEKNKLIEEYRRKRIEGYLAGYGSAGGGVPKNIPKGKFDSQTYEYKPYTQAILDCVSKGMFILLPSENRNELLFKMISGGADQKVSIVNHSDPDLTINSFCEKAMFVKNRYYQVVKDELGIDCIEVYSIK